ncbi:hypothetical protein ACKS0A_04443 [Histoplasma ohiense]
MMLGMLKRTPSDWASCCNSPRYIISTTALEPTGIFPMLVVKVSDAKADCSSRAAAWPFWTACWYSILAFPRSFTIPRMTRLSISHLKPTMLTPSCKGKVYLTSPRSLDVGLMKVWVKIVLEEADNMVEWALRST